MHAMSVKESYTTGARSLASRSVTGLARTRVTPNALTAAGVTLCLVAAVIVPFESRNELLWYWLGAVVFVVGAVRGVSRLDDRPHRRGRDARGDRLRARAPRPRHRGAHHDPRRGRLLPR